MSRLVRAGGLVGAALLGVGAAEALDDLVALARFGPDPWRGALGTVVAAVGGALLGSLTARSARGALVAASLAGIASGLVVAAPFPWVDLGPFGAGPAGELALLVLPASFVLAVLGSAPRGLTGPEDGDPVDEEEARVDHALRSSRT